MLDDVDHASYDRLRDCILTREGMQASLDKSAEAKGGFETAGKGVEGCTLLCVSPMARTILTACLLYSELQQSGADVKVTLEPSCIESINAPHDIVEDIGRPMSVVFLEVRDVLREFDAPASSTN
mmetsp:Transcript_111362/g.359419  ORF Transcript_111362/g.359419 Transcript_111362/m.359419 type:complete len:125 (-) Transcript_111362:232-606(-)